MYTLDELKNQNEEITQLCDVLSVLVEHKSMHNNPYVCELMSRFKEKVWMHLVFEDNTFYSELSGHNDKAVSDIAQQFHDSARQIKKHFSGYIRHWCKPTVADSEHEALLEESREIFRLIRERIEYENRYMFPLVEKYHTA
ncbi:MAG: hemerythrin domain-containing protein [Proteobacteria bacterium]|jgi:iron-sulfur cluster repair protein YtfE (RIC family)|nr:hemerythrin domain-containing protein [Pseudomonadota bacterium]